MGRLFISFTRKDAEFASQLKAELAKRGYEAFVDREDIKLGELWSGLRELRKRVRAIENEA